MAKLSSYGEADLAELVSKGRLPSLFPVQPRETTVPGDFEDDENVPEASAMPLDDQSYAQLVQSSMPPVRSAAQIQSAARTLGVRESDLVRALQIIENRSAGA